MSDCSFFPVLLRQVFVKKTYWLLDYLALDAIGRIHYCGYDSARSIDIIEVKMASLERSHKGKSK